jgi:hypothetical protein
MDKNAKESYRKRVESCKKKHRHPDEITARAAAMDSIQKYHNVKTLYVYNCPVCSGWHLTKSSKDHTIKVTEDDPFNESETVKEEFLKIIQSGPIKTFKEDNPKRGRDDIWLHELCLDLEAQDLICRNNENNLEIEWKFKTNKMRRQERNSQNQKEQFLMAA